MPQIKVFKGFDRLETKGEDVHQEIYEWEYIDQDGELKKDKKNVKEEIQSFLPRTDYKSQIERGELDLQNGGSTHTDFTGIPNDTVAIYDYLNALANLPEEQVTKLLEQVNSGNKESVQGKQATDSKTTSGGQVTQEDVQGKSTDAETFANITGKGKGE